MLFMLRLFTFFKNKLIFWNYFFKRNQSIERSMLQTWNTQNIRKPYLNNLVFIHFSVRLTNKVANTAYKEDKWSTDTAMKETDSESDSEDDNCERMTIVHDCRVQTMWIVDFS